MHRFCLVLLAATALVGPAVHADCTRKHLADLQHKMHQSCDKGGTSCKYSLSLQTLKGNLKTHESCIALRKQIQADCYRNQTDPGHAEAILQKENAAKNCRDLITRKENEAQNPKPAPKGKTAPGKKG